MIEYNIDDISSSCYIVISFAFILECVCVFLLELNVAAQYISVYSLCIYSYSNFLFVRSVFNI